MKKLYCVICGKKKHLRKNISSFIMCCKYKNEDEKILK